MIDFLLGVPGKLKTIYDYLVANLSTTRCAKIDNLDVNIMSRAPASTAVSSADYTPARGPYLDKLNAGGIPGTVKSIQSGVFNVSYTGVSSGLGEDSKYADFTITAVSTSKCVVHLQPLINPADGLVVSTSARLTSATQVRLSKSYGDSYLGGRWTVIEYY